MRLVTDVAMALDLHPCSPCTSPVRDPFIISRGTAAARAGDAPAATSPCRSIPRHSSERGTEAKDARVRLQQYPPAAAATAGHVHVGQRRLDARQLLHQRQQNRLVRTRHHRHGARAQELAQLVAVGAAVLGPAQQALHGQRLFNESMARSALSTAAWRASYFESLPRP